jgi:transposase-like protein
MPRNFKDEAVRQIVGRGYSVAEVSKRFGVSAHSLYKWLKSVQPDNTEEQAPAPRFIGLTNHDMARACEKRSNRNSNRQIRSTPFLSASTRAIFVMNLFRLPRLHLAVRFTAKAFTHRRGDIICYRIWPLRGPQLSSRR